MRKNKIIAVVKFNSKEAFVLRRRPLLKYNRYGNVIIGTDGLFFTCYYYSPPSERFQAFAGRKFDLTMEDGEVIHCNGQW